MHPLDPVFLVAFDSKLMIFAVISMISIISGIDFRGFLLGLIGSFYLHYVCTYH